MSNKKDNRVVRGEETNIKQLPEELVLDIIHFIVLNPKEIITLQGINKTFFKICQEDSLWKLQFKNFFPKYDPSNTKNLKKLFFQAQIYQKQKRKTISEIKITVLGKTGTGKSPFIISFVQNLYVDQYDPTILDSYRKQLILNDRNVFLDISDTSGLEEYSVIILPLIRKSDVFILCYDVYQSKSWDKVEEYYELLKKKKNHPLKVVLACLKYDLVKEVDNVPWDRVEKFQKENDVKNFKVSSKLNQNVKETFIQAVNEVTLELTYQEWKDLEAGKYDKKDEKKKCVIM